MKIISALFLFSLAGCYGDKGAVCEHYDRETGFSACRWNNKVMLYSKTGMFLLDVQNPPQAEGGNMADKTKAVKK